MYAGSPSLDCTVQLVAKAGEVKGKWLTVPESGVTCRHLQIRAKSGAHPRIAGTTGGAPYMLPRGWTTDD